MKFGKRKTRCICTQSAARAKARSVGWRVLARAPGGTVIDKIRTDDKRVAREYFRAFCQLAKNA